MRRESSLKRPTAIFFLQFEKISQSLKLFLFENSYHQPSPKQKIRKSLTVLKTNPSPPMQWWENQSFPANALQWWDNVCSLLSLRRGISFQSWRLKWWLVAHWRQLQMVPATPHHTRWCSTILYIKRMTQTGCDTRKNTIKAGGSTVGMDGSVMI